MTLSLVHDGKQYTGWTSITVEAGMSKAARSFTANLSEPRERSLTAPFWCAPGDEVEIYAGRKLVLKGFINEYRPSFDANSHSVTISGRSKSQDSVDSSAAHPTGRFENRSVLSIAQELAGIVGNEITSAIQTPTVTKFQINQGETVAGAIQRLIRAHGFTLSGLADGSMRIGVGTDDDRYDGYLLEGKHPLLSASATIKDTARFSEVQVKTQQAGDQNRFGTDAAQGISKVVDKAVKRFRPRIDILGIASNSQTATANAEWEARRIAGKSVQVDATVQGFHMTDDQLWEPNKLIYVRSPMLKVDHELLIDSVRYKTDAGGSTTALKLVVPKTAGSKAGKKSKPSSAAPVTSTTRPQPRPAFDDPETEKKPTVPLNITPGEKFSEKWGVGPR